MSTAVIDQAIELLEKANADLQPELLPAPVTRRLLASYARAEKLAAFGVAALARKVDASHVARITGVSAGRARAVVQTGKTMSQSDDLSAALQHGDISLDQAVEIARAEESAPGAAAELVDVAHKQPFHVLKDKVRKARLEAEQHRDLGARQRAAREARSHSDDLGMVHIHVALEPHVGTRSSPGPKRRRRALGARRGRSSDGSRSSVTSPTPMRHCWRAPARAGRGGRSSSCS
jgi:hypothetical protein